jgi:hypothetical protein
MSKGTWRNGKHGLIRVGQRVAIPGVSGNVRAEVVEDRGYIGVRGRQIVRLRTLDELVEARREFEMPAEDLIVVE